MPDSGVIDISGEGESLFTTVYVTGIQWWMETETVEVDHLSTTFPSKILHAGWVALASGDGSSAGATLNNQQLSTIWWSFFDFTSQFAVNPGNYPFMDRVIWHLETGVTGHVQVFW